MFGLFKKVCKCKHDWHYLKDDYIYVDNGCDVDVEDGCWIFCLKCEQEKLVYKGEWERIKRKQEIIRMYQKD
jgi:hypothetical protein